MSTDTVLLQDEAPSALPPGTRLGEFELKQVLGIGGFGIVYLAFDHALQREVAVKEYMPAALAGRTQTMQVSLRSASDAETFALGLRSFVNEARLLARFDHPSLLKVYRFWEANGTAYMAMPVLRGRTLKHVRKSMPGAPDEGWLRALLAPLLGAIERLHAQGVYHRDIAPDNIQIGPDGQPVLMDFGAARRVIGDRRQALTAILKPSYAPIEQYADGGAVPQGPWTDIYALGATLHYLLLARPPAPATARTVHDEPSALTPAALPATSPAFLHLVRWMLAPRPADRPQSIAEVREVLAGRRQPPLGVTPEAAPPTPTAWQATPWVARGATADIELPLDGPPAHPPPPPATPSSRRHVPPRHRGLEAVVVACGVAVVGLSLAAYALWPAPPAATGSASVFAPPTPPPAAPAGLDAPAEPAAAPASTAAAESTITTVVVPVRAAVRAPVEEVVFTNVGKPAEPQAPVLAARPATPRAVTTAAPAAVAVVAATPAARIAVEPTGDPSGDAGPEAQCGGRNPLRHFVCMERACLRSELAAHPDCLRWRKEARRE